MDAAAGGLGRTTTGGDGSRADPARHGGRAVASITRHNGDERAREGEGAWRALQAPLR